MNSPNIMLIKNIKNLNEQKRRRPYSIAFIFIYKAFFFGLTRFINLCISLLIVIHNISRAMSQRLQKREKKRVNFN
jgi:hypothetical protein